MIKIIPSTEAQALLDAMKKRSAQIGAGVNAAAFEIVEAVRQEGFEAVRRYSLELDGTEPYELTRAEIDAARARIDPELDAALVRAAGNIRDYQARILIQSQEWDAPGGGRLGQLVRGLDRVGIYVPGGTAAYPSSVLMNAVPAKVAGVREIIMATPPTQNLSDAVLAAASIAGVDRVIAVGGAQAVAALAFGAGFIPRVDKLTGPGNAYVAAAKRMVYGAVDIDMVAGPSEVLIIADAGANPAWVAADLLSQAEHDVLSCAMLLTDSAALAEAVAAQLKGQIAHLSRRSIIEQSLEDFGAAIICTDLAEAAELANRIAPEHLEVMTVDPRALLPFLHNAGAIFLGSYSPEPLGDYMAGPSHVLPTSGTARFFSPLSAESFLKRTSLIAYTAQGLSACAGDIVALASAEGLGAHANSIAQRMEDHR